MLRKQSMFLGIIAQVEDNEFSLFSAIREPRPII